MSELAIFKGALLWLGGCLAQWCAYREGAEKDRQVDEHHYNVPVKLITLGERVPFHLGSSSSSNMKVWEHVHWVHESLSEWVKQVQAFLWKKKRSEMCSDYSLMRKDGGRKRERKQDADWKEEEENIWLCNVLNRREFFPLSFWFCH